MNLARVEHYFADFLSALEAGTSIHLHDIVPVEEGESEDDEPVPRMLRIPPNVFFIGTVNVDESTYMFSPKVLDRAFAIELNTVDLHALAQGAETGGEIDLVKWNGRLDPPARPQRADWQWLTTQEEGELGALVTDIHAALARHNRHFGYRVATEVGRFVRLAVEQSGDPEAAAWAALDVAILEKILVKLSGTQADLQDIVQSLLEIALAGRGDATLRDLARWRLDPVADAVTSADEAEGREPIFPRSAAKLWRMRDRLLRQGFASWVE
jgi:5-methylcytosine-specific restriction protein B